MHELDLTVYNQGFCVLIFSYTIDTDVWGTSIQTWRATGNKVEAIEPYPLWE